MPWLLLLLLPPQPPPIYYHSQVLKPVCMENTVHLQCLEHIEYNTLHGPSEDTRLGRLDNQEGLAALVFCKEHCCFMTLLAGPAHSPKGLSKRYSSLVRF